MKNEQRETVAEMVFDVTVVLILLLILLITSALAEAHGWRRYACAMESLKPPPNMFLTDCGVMSEKEVRR